MKNKNGFTLVELLTVIGLIGVISVFVISGVVSLLGKTKCETEKIGYQSIFDSAKLFASDLIQGNQPYNFDEADEDAGLISYNYAGSKYYYIIWNEPDYVVSSNNKDSSTRNNFKYIEENQKSASTTFWKRFANIFTTDSYNNNTDFFESVLRNFWYVRDDGYNYQPILAGDFTWKFPADNVTLYTTGKKIDEENVNVSAGYEIVNAGGETMDVCSGGFVLTKGSGDSFEMLAVCEYDYIDDPSVSEMPISYGYKFIKFSAKGDKSDGCSRGRVVIDNSSTNNMGQVGVEYCTNTLNSYFASNSVTVYNLVGNQISKYALKLFFNSNSTDNNTHFIHVTARELHNLGYYNDGKCEYNQIANDSDTNDEERSKCRIYPDCSIGVGIVTGSESGDTLSNKYVQVSGYKFNIDYSKCLNESIQNACDISGEETKEYNG